MTSSEGEAPSQTNILPSEPCSINLYDYKNQSLSFFAKLLGVDQKTFLSYIAKLKERRHYTVNTPAWGDPLQYSFTEDGDVALRKILETIQNRDLKKKTRASVSDILEGGIQEHIEEALESGYTLKMIRGALGTQLNGLLDFWTLMFKIHGANTPDAWFINGKMPLVLRARYLDEFIKNFRTSQANPELRNEISATLKRKS